MSKCYLPLRPDGAGPCVIIDEMCALYLLLLCSVLFIETEKNTFAQQIMKIKNIYDFKGEQEIYRVYLSTYLPSFWAVGCMEKKTSYITL